MRLARLAHVWGAVRYFHPYLFDRRLDLDAWLAQAIAAVADATTEDAEADAVSRMIAALNDPLTRVDDDAAIASLEPSQKPSAWVHMIGGVTVVKLAPRGSGHVADAIATARHAIESASAVVIDARAARDGAAARAAASAVDGLAEVLLAHDTAVAPIRWIRHEGYEPQSGASSGNYRTEFVTAPERVHRAQPGPHPARVAFVVNSAVGVPELAAAMQRTGDAVIVAQGEVAQTTFQWMKEVPIGEHHVVRIAGSEYVSPPNPDVQLPGEPDTQSGGEAIGAALKSLRSVKPVRAPLESSPLVRNLDPLYPTGALPTRERRLIALFRFWNVIHYFYPYQHLLDAPWDDDVLADFIPRFEDASTPLEYSFAVHELASRISDSHVWIHGDDAFAGFVGTGSLEIEVRRIEGLPVVTGLTEATARAGLAAGDVIVDVGGEPFDARAARLAKYVAASNDRRRASSADALALFCQKDGEVVVHARNAMDHLVETKLRCGRFAQVKRTGPVFTTMGADIGYVDLDRLEQHEVDAMFAALANTRAIVFDMRGYPHGTAWAIAARLNAHGMPVVGAEFARMLVTPEHVGEAVPRVEFSQFVDTPLFGKALYSGRTVMLIDERTQSQAEYTGLFLEAANGTKFIGSATAGANGDITSTCLPGGLCITFTGHDVRHADGRQLQRVGLTPDIEARPTVRSIREGRDEVLDRALVYLRTGK